MRNPHAPAVTRQVSSQPGPSSYQVICRCGGRFFGWNRWEALSRWRVHETAERSRN